MFATLTTPKGFISVNLTKVSDIEINGSQITIFYVSEKALDKVYRYESYAVALECFKNFNTLVRTAE